jgi:hypothetical protein
MLWLGAGLRSRPAYGPTSISKALQRQVVTRVVRIAEGRFEVWNVESEVVMRIMVLWF